MRWKLRYIWKEEGKNKTIVRQQHLSGTKQVVLESYIGNTTNVYVQFLEADTNHLNPHISTYTSSCFISNSLLSSYSLIKPE